MSQILYGGSHLWAKSASNVAHVLAEERVYKAAKPNKVESYLERNEAKVGRRLDSVIQDWARKAAKRIIRSFSSALGKADAALIARILRSIESKGFSVDVVDELTPDLKRAFRDAGIAALAEVGIKADLESGALDQVDEAAVAFAERRGAQLVTQIEDSTRDYLRMTVTQGVEEGWSAAHLAEEIRASGAFAESRALMIARTELAFAHVAGNIEGYKNSGLVEGKRWLASADACPICEELNGEEVALDETFDFDGEEIDAPPGHPNCRCDVVPILKGEEE